MAKKRVVKRKAKKTRRKAKTTRRKAKTTRRKAKKTRRKAKTTKRKAKKAFGGYSISFKNRNESLELVFGKPSITPSEMTKKLWKFIKKKRLGKK